MLPPRSWKAATAASATRAAATAYSDNSRPDSSLKKCLITFLLLLRFLAPLFNCVCQRVDLGADVAAQQLEGGDGGERDERCGDGVFRQFKTCFIAKESLNHFVCSFRVWLMV